MNWKSLECRFFASTCESVLGDYFTSHGFSKGEITSIGGVIYRRSNLFVEVSYVPETLPSYTPSIIIGLGADKYDKAGKPLGVPGWFIFPAEAPERKYSFWTFDTEQSLVVVLTRIKDEILNGHVRPLWNDEKTLRKLIHTFRTQA